MNLSLQLNALLKSKKRDPRKLLSAALEIGINKLWVDEILEQYLSGKLSRKEAVRFVGLDAVKLSEKQDKAMQEDIAWGLLKK